MTGKASKTVPFSIRLTPAERQELERRAGKRPIGLYARERLFGHIERDIRRLRAKRSTAPSIDKAALAQVLGLLGKSDDERSLKQIGEAAQIGALPLTQDVQERIEQACRDIAVIKSTLMRALGINED